MCGDGEVFFVGCVLVVGILNLVIEIDGQVCGSISVQQGVVECGYIVELGYWLGQVYWGQGLMIWVVGLFVLWVMDELCLFRLQVIVVDFNFGLVWVLEKNGFWEEGVECCVVYKCGVLYDLCCFVWVCMQLF